MKIISAVAVVAALSLALPVVALGQQVTGKNGAVLDGMGAGGQVANTFVYDGPPNTSAANFDSLHVSSSRMNSASVNVACDLRIFTKAECDARLQSEAPLHSNVTISPSY